MSASWQVYRCNQGLKKKIGQLLFPPVAILTCMICVFVDLIHSHSQLWRRAHVLTLESVDEILWCDHSNETFLAVILHGTKV